MQNFFPCPNPKDRKQKSAGNFSSKLSYLKQQMSVEQVCKLDSFPHDETVLTNVQSHRCQIYNSQLCQVSKEM